MWGLLGVGVALRRRRVTDQDVPAAAGVEPAPAHDPRPAAA
jgi:hypothetical protein